MLAADGKVAKLATALLETFVDAEVQHFGFNELDPRDPVGRGDARHYVRRFVLLRRPCRH
jgi:hypothetical protein